MSISDHIYLNLIDLNALPAILAYRDYFSNRDNKFYRISSNDLQPYEYPEEIQDFIRKLYQANIIQPFNWVAWRESDEGQQLMSYPSRIKEAPIEEVIKLLIAHLRSDRFIAGHLATVIEEGQINLILERFEELIGKQNLTLA
ncbi:MAG: hypothetical protein KDC28_12350 [Saprospiraceae bacterium]|nr:hypothetical protein [Saprospiraceae bacterium]MCB9319103.1 hypothetical protein [Lewinellaceae bacterium]